MSNTAHPTSLAEARPSTREGGEQQDKATHSRQRPGMLRGRPAGSAHSIPSAPFARTAVQPIVPNAYPLYKQRDAAWGDDRIGSETDVTICDVGCLMSSISMALAFNNITIPDLAGSAHLETSNPLVC